MRLRQLKALEKAAGTWKDADYSELRTAKAGAFLEKSPTV
jgi:hypothetical protein